MTVNAQRDAGFHDAVRFDVQGLPAGASAAAIAVVAGSSTGALTFQAAAEAPPSLPTNVTVKARPTQAKTLTLTVRGAAGSVDTSFAGGKLVTPGGLTDDYVRGVAVQADGKVVGAGFGFFSPATGTDFMLVRHLRDGGLDTGFGKGGKASTAFNNGGRSNEAQAVAVQPDGKILVAGSSDQGAGGYDFALARYLANGTLDMTFGNGGRVTTSFGNGADKAYALLQPDGRIVLAGDSIQAGEASGISDLDNALMRHCL